MTRWEQIVKRISPERKAAALAKLLPPYNMTVTAVAPMEGISEATLYYWRNKAKAEEIPVPGRDLKNKPILLKIKTHHK
ncbi:transposase [Pectobacterium parmentieri]|nr:transposase [Pectobacterium parmentieri]